MDLSSHAGTVCRAQTQTGHATAASWMYVHGQPQTNTHIQIKNIQRLHMHERFTAADSIHAFNSTANAAHNGRTSRSNNMQIQS